MRTIHSMKMLVVVVLQLSLLHWVSLAAETAAAGGAGEQQWSTQPANVKGDVLILDVGSLMFQGNHPMSPPFQQQEGCADACARTVGCNAWTFCDRKEGCGSGCRAYTAQNPPVKIAIGPNDNPTLPNPAWKQLKTITGFGPWGLTAGCKVECNADRSSCQPGDAWPYGMCSLKKLADPRQPQFWSTNAAEGWVSGFTQTPPECAAIPARSCTRCMHSKDPLNCLKCASNPALAPASMLDSVLNRGLARTDGCSSCYNSDEPQRCVACLNSNAPCAQCALQETPTTTITTNNSNTPQGSTDTIAVGACITCTTTHGPKFRDACIACARLGNTTSSGSSNASNTSSASMTSPKTANMTNPLATCMSCINTMKPLACDSTEWPATCWNPTIKPSSCATCVSSASSSYDTCLSCLTSQPYSENCEGCSTLSGAEKRAQCYACSKAAKHPGSGCTDCLRYLTDARQQQQCLSCLATPSMSAEGKSWCYGCQNWCPSSESRAKCVACLNTKQDAYMTACGCS